MSAYLLDLTSLGWDESFADAFLPYATDHVPARVSRVDRGREGVAGAAVDPADSGGQVFGGVGVKGVGEGLVPAEGLQVKGMGGAVRSGQRSRPFVRRKGALRADKVERSAGTGEEACDVKDGHDELLSPGAVPWRLVP